MIEKLRELRKYLDPNYIAFGSASDVEIVETAKEGAGTVTLQVAGEFLHIKARAGQHQIIWLENTSCADGSVIVVHGDKVCIHLIELKSNIGGKAWKKARLQFEGMLLNSLALLGCAGVVQAFEVKCHLAYKSQGQDASPIFEKIMPELQMPTTGFEGWKNRSINLPFGIAAEFVKHERDGAGNVHLGHA